MGYFDDVFFSTFGDTIEGVELDFDQAPYFQAIEDRYPIHWQRIDWTRVPQSVIEFRGVSPLDFFRKEVERHSLNGPAVYLGEDLSFAVLGDLDRLKILLPELFTNPQPHFLFAQDLSWCFQFTMEGEAGFGFAGEASTV